MQQKCRILLVEDSELARQVAKEYLIDLGYKNVIEASDGLIAFMRLQKLKIDLIISDWEMPRMDGLELLKKIKNIDKLSHIPFIILTAVDSREKVIQAIRAGAKSYIVKPVSPEILKEKVENAFSDT